MKLSDAMSAYRLYGQKLLEQKKELERLHGEAVKKAEITKNEENIDEVVTLELSIEGMNKKIDDNAQTLESLIEQECLIIDSESLKQQSEDMEDIAVELSKILEVARRISKGDKVPFTDERKLMEYSSDLYQTAKAAGMLIKKKEYKEYDSLWEEDNKEPENTEDPLEIANNTEVTIDIPDIEEL